MNDLMDEYKASMIKHLKCYIIDKGTTHYNIPFCLAGETYLYDPADSSARKLLTTEDWLVNLWKTFEVCGNPEIKSILQKLLEFLQQNIKDMLAAQLKWKCYCESKLNCIMFLL